MELSLTLADGENTGDQLASLYRWLRQDPDITDHIDVRHGQGTAPPGTMSGTLEVINLAVSNTLALANLFVAVGAWRGTRRGAPEVRVERDGLVLTVTGDDPEKVRALIADLGTANRP
ncbi:hypothetical protein ACGFNV_24520 [Streptomyces sp. NPDC048751]|uniref:effector-associated constant component EACC1 n=1 Tax=Streptomyces sp. NPDC048751 TaxID=3365591 RepID=UPI00371358E7